MGLDPVVVLDFWRVQQLRLAKVRVWRDLVDMVTHTCSRLLHGWASQMGLPTVWKGEGRVRDRKLFMIWVPLKCSIALDTVFCTGLLKPLYW